MALPLPTVDSTADAPAGAGAPSAGPARNEGRRAQYLDLKANVQRQLLARLNFETLSSTAREQAEGEIRAVVSSLIVESGAQLSNDEREAILGDVLDEVFGSGTHRAVAARQDRERYSHQHVGACVCRAEREDSNACRRRFRMMSTSCASSTES